MDVRDGAVAALEAVASCFRRNAELAEALDEAIGQLRGYAQSDYDSWTTDEGAFDDPDLERQDAEAWAAIHALEAVLAGGPRQPPEAP